MRALKNKIYHSFKMEISFPEDGYKIDELLIIDRPRKEIYEAIKNELYHTGCAISDCCAESLALTHSITEIVIANLITHYGFAATEKAKQRYLLVKNAKPDS